MSVSKRDIAWRRVSKPADGSSKSTYPYFFVIKWYI